MALKNWSIYSVEIDTDTQLLQGTDSTECILLSLVICNYSSDDANIEVVLCDDGESAKAQIIKNILYAGQTLLFSDFKLALNNGDMIFVKSSQIETSFIASGDET